MSILGAALLLLVTLPVQGVEVEQKGAVMDCGGDVDCLRPSTPAEKVACLQAIVNNGGQSPVTGSVAGYLRNDAWCFVGIQGRSVTFSVDTVSAATSSDLYACLSQGVNMLPALACGDDNFPCTFPPVAYSCPLRTVTLPSTDVYWVGIDVWDWFWTPPTPAYELSVTMNGQPVQLGLYADDRPEQVV